MDAVELIKKYDSHDAFFYVDPPYYNADMGHYGGYTANDFESLLKTLSTVKGKFLLSCYPSELIKKYINKNGWSSREYAAFTSATISCKTRERTEVLTFNYELEKEEKNDIK
jgi:DNA adenine methylase